jgi:hypothetical protein
MDRDVNELPYGDERPTSARRRRAEDEPDRRDSRDSKVRKLLTPEHTGSPISYAKQHL